MMFQPEMDVEQTPAECLYQAMLPNLPQYMVSSSHQTLTLPTNPLVSHHEVQQIKQTLGCLAGENWFTSTDDLCFNTATYYKVNQHL